MLATQARGLVAAVWLATAVDPMLGARALLRVLAAALSIPFAFLLVSAVVSWVRGRDLGRAFDLASVAVVPMLAIQLVVLVVVRAGHLHVPPALHSALWGVSFAWAGALAALALGSARPRTATTPPAPRHVRRRGAIIGAMLASVAAAGLTTEVVRIATDVDTVRPMSVGDPAPRFVLSVVPPDGLAAVWMDLKSQRGHVVVVDFWATWCGPCLRALPKLDALARRYPDVTVMAINIDDATAARALWDERGYQMLLLQDDDGEVTERWGVTQIPHTVVIDRAGVVRHVARGAVGDLGTIIETLRGEQIRN